MGIVSNEDQLCVPGMGYVVGDQVATSASHGASGPFTSSDKDVRVLGGVFRLQSAHVGHSKIDSSS